MSSRSGLLSQLQLSDQERGEAAPANQRFRWSMWTALLFVVASAFGLGMWMQAPRSAASASVQVPGPVMRLETTAGQASRRNPSPAMNTRDTVSATAVVLEATGYVVARQQATVSSQIEGLLTEVLVEEGDSVVAGQILARLDAGLLGANLRLARSQLEATRLKLPELQVKVDEAEAASQRAQSLLRDRQISVVEADDARFTLAAARAAYAQIRREVVVAEDRLAVQEQQLDRAEIRAPFAGVVVDKAAQTGEIISPYSGTGSSRTGICTIVDMSSIEIEVDVNESNVNLVHPGQRATAAPVSWPDRAIPAEVVTIVPMADRNRGTVRVRIRLLEHDSRILPDMAVRVAFASERKGETTYD